VKNLHAVLSLFAVLVTLLASVGCQRNQRPPLKVVVLLDVSASIEPESESAAFDAVQNVMGRLHRGDSMVVIPITGDAENESQGRIVRFALPQEREAYDQDLRRAVKSLKQVLAEMKTKTLSKPGSHTDILGAFRLAAEEIRAGASSKKAVILVLSDLIQDDARFDFNQARAVASPESAKGLAKRLAQESNLRIPNIPIFLGLLRSKDLSRLRHERRQAIQEFWQQYVVAAGARPTLAVDGPGLVTAYVENLE
jgi:hypothetical protein